MIMQISKIVITGGPCAGKTTLINCMEKIYSNRGYHVLLISETATELISSGIAPWTCRSNYEYKVLQMKMQLSKEKIFEEAARHLQKDKVLIICDRGCADNKAYMKKEEYEKILSEIGLSEVEARDHYDAVFHMVTAAKGAEEQYTLSNNKARTETIEKAVEIDDQIISAWTGHPHLRVIENTGDFQQKLDRTIEEISLFLGDPEPLEIERKFLIRYPDITALEKLSNCHKIEIEQIYLDPAFEKNARIRKRGEKNQYIYYKTVKHKITDITYEEIENRITEEEYLFYAQKADKTRRKICKDRYCLVYQGQYFEIDIFPFWNEQALIELELRSENQEIIFPPEIKVIKEVTHDAFYKNSALALMNFKEKIKK